MLASNLYLRANTGAGPVHRPQRPRLHRRPARAPGPTGLVGAQPRSDRGSGDLLLLALAVGLGRLLLDYSGAHGGPDARRPRRRPRPRPLPPHRPAAEEPPWKRAGHVATAGYVPAPGASWRPAPGPDAVLAVEGVTFAYQDGTVALRNLSLAIPRGRRTAILGANGSGKSTLFLHLNGILRPQRGRVLLGGKPVAYDRAGLNDLRRRVGLVFQDPDSQLFAASVRQDISSAPSTWACRRRGTPEVEQAVRDTQIEDLADRPTHLLSYGQKKRVAIAGVLAMEPEVIVADEPTAGLDPGRRRACSPCSTGCTAGAHHRHLHPRRGAGPGLGRPRARAAPGELLGGGPPGGGLRRRLLPPRGPLVQPIVLDAFLRLLGGGRPPSPLVPRLRTAAQLAGPGQRRARPRRRGPAPGEMGETGQTGQTGQVEAEGGPGGPSGPGP